MQNTVYSGDGPNISILVVLDQKMLKIQKPVNTDVDKVVELYEWRHESRKYLAELDSWARNKVQNDICLH